MLKVLGATVTLLAVLVAGVWVLPASHDQGELSGIWRFRVRLESGRSTVRFLLRQDGEVLSGTYDGSYGALPITGTASGDDIEFSFVIQADPASSLRPLATAPPEDTRVTYRGTIHDGTMSGKCDYGEVSGEGTWEAERANSIWDF
jgi:hypothetical protein